MTSISLICPNVLWVEMQPDLYEFGIPAGKLRLGMAYLASARSTEPGPPPSSQRYLNLPCKPSADCRGGPCVPARKEPFMQQSSASFNNFSRQLPFGPKTLVFGATALIAYGLTRRSKAGTALAAAGGLLAYKAVQTTPTTADTHAVFLVNASPEQAYTLWRNFAA